MGLALCVILIGLQQPAPAPPTLEQLVERLAAERKAAAETEAEVRKRLKDLTEKLRELGIVPAPGPGPGPNPTPPDALAKKLRDAFERDNGKREDALSLAAL